MAMIHIHRQDKSLSEFWLPTKYPILGSRQGAFSWEIQSGLVYEFEGIKVIADLAAFKAASDAIFANPDGRETCGCA